MNLAGRLTVILLLFALPLLHAADPETERQAQALLEQASRLGDLRSPGSPPFHLQADIRVRMGPKEFDSGKYALLWESPSRWREEIYLPGYVEIRVGDTGKNWQWRNVDYGHLRAEDLDRAISLSAAFDLGNSETVEDIRHRKIRGARSRCIETRHDPDFRFERCFDVESGLLLEFKHLAVKVQYEDYEAFGNKWFPRRLRLFNERDLAVEVRVSKLEHESGAPAALFEPPEGSTAWPHCQQVEAPELVQRAQPTYPSEAKSRRQQGDVTFYAVVEEDGTLADLHVVQTAGPALDKAALEAVRQWRYSPRLCDGRPARVEMFINIKFRIN